MGVPAFEKHIRKNILFYNVSMLTSYFAQTLAAITLWERSGNSES